MTRRMMPKHLVDGLIRANVHEARLEVGVLRAGLGKRGAGPDARAARPAERGGPRKRQHAHRRLGRAGSAGTVVRSLRPAAPGPTGATGVTIAVPALVTLSVVARLRGCARLIGRAGPRGGLAVRARAGPRSGLAA